MQILISHKSAEDQYLNTENLYFSMKQRAIKRQYVGQYDL